jgi:hypothetical protein
VSLAYRRVRDETKKRPVALIVICDACGNREIGWAWHDHGVMRWWDVEGPYVEDDPAQHKRLRRETPKGVLRRLEREWPTVGLRGDWGPVRFKARCPNHGDVTTPEIDLAELEPARTRRCRAFGSTA